MDDGKITNEDLDRKVFEILASSFPSSQQELLRTASQKILQVVSSSTTVSRNNSPEKESRRKQEVRIEQHHEKETKRERKLTSKSTSSTEKLPAAQGLAQLGLQSMPAIATVDKEDGNLLDEGGEADRDTEEGGFGSEFGAFGDSPEDKKHRTASLEGQSPLCLDISLPSSPSLSLARPSPDGLQAAINQSNNRSNNASRKGNPPVRWTEEQDEMLRTAVQIHGAKNWKAVAALVKGRNHVQCLQRWNKVLQPGLIKGPWTKAEDDKLIELAMSLEKNWALISQHIEGRTAKQCRERWRLNLDPSINHDPFTPEEDALLLKLRAELGNRWAEIKQRFKGRTENSVKTRHKSLMRLKAREWTKEQDELVLRLYEQHGEDWDTIAEQVKDKTASAIRLRIRRLLRDSDEGKQQGATVQGSASKENTHAATNKPKRSSSSSSLRVESAAPRSGSSAAGADATSSVVKQEKRGAKAKRSISASSSGTAKSKRRKGPKGNALTLNTKDLGAGPGLAGVSPFSMFSRSPVNLNRSIPPFSGNVPVPTMSPMTIPQVNSSSRQLPGQAANGIVGHNMRSSSATGSFPMAAQFDHHTMASPNFGYSPRNMPPSAAGPFDFVSFQDFDPLCTPRSSFPPSPRNVEISGGGGGVGDFDPALSPTHYLTPLILSARGHKSFHPDLLHSSSTSQTSSSIQPHVQQQQHGRVQSVQDNAGGNRSRAKNGGSFADASSSASQQSSEMSSSSGLDPLEALF